MRQSSWATVWSALLLAALGSRCLGQSEAANALARGDFTQAAALSQKLLDRNPRSIAVRVLLIRALFAEGDLNGAFNKAEQGLNFSPDSPDLLYYAIRLSAELGRSTLEELHRAAPESSRSHQVLAEIAMAQEDSARAISEYQEALNADPANREALVSLADAERAGGLCDKAMAHYQRATELDAHDADSFYGWGACLLLGGDLDAAVTALRQTVTLTPDYAGAQFALGEALFKQGNLRESLPPLEAAVRLEPRFQQAYFLLGRAYKGVGDAARSEAAMKRFQALKEEEVEAGEKRASARQKQGEATGDPSLAEPRR